MKVFLICLLLSFSVSAQKNWSLESIDGSITVINYQAFDETLDSVVVQHKDSRLLLLDDSLCENLNDQSCKTGTNGVSFISDIKALDENRYILIAFGSYPDGSLIDVMIYNKEIDDIDKWLVIDSYNRFLRGIIFYYMEDKNILLIPKSLNEIQDDFIYDVDYKKNTFEKIAVVKINFGTFLLSNHLEGDRFTNNMCYEVPLDKDIPIKIQKTDGEK